MIIKKVMKDHSGEYGKKRKALPPLRGEGKGGGERPHEASFLPLTLTLSPQGERGENF